MRVRELFDLPTAPLTRVQFVAKLSEALTPALRRETVETWVATPALVTCMGEALDLMKAALHSNQSQVAFLDGSFGAGKSHFMAMLGLLLADDRLAWARTELHALRARHDWIGTKTILEIPYHFLGAQSVPQKIFEGYVERIRALHPRAPLPPLYRDQELFQNAREMLERMGEALFFSTLNEGEADEDDGLGDYGRTIYDRARFEAAIASADPKDRDPLFAALTRTLFSSFAKQTDRFLDFDSGLAALTRHARQLGYDAVILMLDELILWLMGKQQNSSFVTDQCQQLAKLIEYQNLDRPIPIVATIARQRRLEDVIGREGLGIEQDGLRQAVEWLAERFKTITLADTNLPEIVEKRVLKPKSAEGQSARAAATERILATMNGPDRDVLYGNLGDEAVFRKLHPFSPVLVQTLVVLSGALQRERTALRILMELLIDHVGDESIETLVPVGDLFDILVEGSDQPMDPVLKQDFEGIKSLYHDKLLPRIKADHRAAIEGKCQREKPEHRQALGCSGCQMTACRNDNRIAKTILLAALIKQRPPLDRLTMRRVVALNHGHLRATFGDATSAATGKVRRWMQEDITELQLGGEQDPSVQVIVSAVDIAPILRRHQGVDTAPGRRIRYRELLFSLLGLDVQRSDTASFKVLWRGTERLVTLRFGNVHQLEDRDFEPGDKADVHLVIDFPFDQQGKGPEHDAHRLSEWKSARPEGAPTFVWMPTFLSEAGQRLLGELVILEELSRPERWREEARSFNEEQRPALEQQLKARLSNRTSSLEQATLVAFGLRKRDDAPGLVDWQRKPEDGLVSLALGQEARPVAAGNFAAAKEELSRRLLDARYPQHPELRGDKLTKGKAEELLQQCEQLLEAEGRRGPRGVHDQGRVLSHYGEPLGLVKLTEQDASLQDALFEEIDRALARDGAAASPTVRDLRRALDPERKRGYTAEVADLLVMVWAKRRHAEFVSPTGRTLPGQIGKLEADWVVRSLPMPNVQDWKAASQRGSEVFALTLPPSVLSAKNLQRFCGDLRRRLDEVGPTLQAALKGLKRRSHEMLQSDQTERLQTMQALVALVQALEAREGVDLVRALASAELGSSPAALGKAWIAVKELRPLLDNETAWTAMSTAAKVNLPEAEELSRRLREALMRDELHKALVAELRQLEQLANRVMRSLATPSLGAVTPSPAAEADSWVREKAAVPGARRLTVQTTGAEWREALARELRGLSDEDQVHLQIVIQPRAGERG